MHVGGNIPFISPAAGLGLHDPRRCSGGAVHLGFCRSARPPHHGEPTSHQRPLLQTSEGQRSWRRHILKKGGAPGSPRPFSLGLQGGVPCGFGVAQFVQVEGLMSNLNTLQFRLNARANDPLVLQARSPPNPPFDFRVARIGPAGFDCPPAGASGGLEALPILESGDSHVEGNSTRGLEGKGESSTSPGAGRCSSGRRSSEHPPSCSPLGGSCRTPRHSQEPMERPPGEGSAVRPQEAPCARLNTAWDVHVHPVGRAHHRRGNREGEGNREDGEDLVRLRRA